MFSVEALTSCKLANINHATTEQQAACQSPGNKTHCQPPADLPQRLLDNFAHLLKNSNIFYILSSNLKKKKKKNFAKNILAIRCFSKNNKNIQVFIGLTFCSLLYWKEMYCGTIDRCLFWWQVLCGLTLDSDSCLFAICNRDGPFPSCIFSNTVLQGMFRHLANGTLGPESLVS